MRRAKSGKGNGKPHAPTADSLPRAPMPKKIVAPKALSAGTGASESEDSKAYSAILEQLRQHRDALPEALRGMVDRQCKDDHTTATKRLHKAVSSQAQAKKELRQLRAARQDYIAAWGGYIVKLCEVWEEQVMAQDQAMQAFADKEAEWTQQLTAATTEIKMLAKDGVTLVAEEEDSGMELDDAVDASEAKVAAVAAAESRQASMIESMKQQRQNITGILEAAKAEAILQSEEVRERTPRRKAPPTVDLTGSPEAVPRKAPH